MTLCTTNLLTFCVVFPHIYYLLYNLQHVTNDLQTFYYVAFYTIKSEILCAISALTLSFMESVTCHLCLTNIFCVTIYTKYCSENLCGIFNHILSFKQAALFGYYLQTIYLYDILHNKIMITLSGSIGHSYFSLLCNPGTRRLWLYKHFHRWHSAQQIF